MSDGSICTAEEQDLFNSTHGTSIVCLTRNDSIGLTLVAESGFISLFAVLGIFVLIFVRTN
jgi:cell division protein FtsW (lipid II flippase)